MSASFGRRLGALGGFAFDVVGEMWARPELSRRDRSLIVVSTLAAQARDEELELHTQIAIRNGLTRSEVEEIVVTVAVYAGFPAAMAASRRVDAGLRAATGVDELSGRVAAAAKSDEERDRDGADVFAAVSGGSWRQPIPRPTSRSLSARARRRRRARVPVGVRRGLGAHRAGPAGPFARRHRHPHRARHRRRSWPSTCPTGVRHGLSRVEIEAAITHLGLYAGVPRAVEAMRAARAAFAKLDSVSVRAADRRQP